MNADRFELHLDGLLEPCEARELESSPDAARELELEREVRRALRASCTPPLRLAARLERELAKARRRFALAVAALVVASISVIAVFAARRDPALELGRELASDYASSTLASSNGSLAACNSPSGERDAALARKLARDEFGLPDDPRIVAHRTRGDLALEIFVYQLDGRSVWLAVGRDEASLDLKFDAASGLHAFAGVVGPRFALEVTPFDESRVLPSLERSR